MQYVRFILLARKLQPKLSNRLVNPKSIIPAPSGAEIKNLILDLVVEQEMSGFSQG